MTVTICTPTISERSHMLDRLDQIINAQTYPIHEWLIDSTADPIGRKRNKLKRQATGDIIVHMDDDDFYANDWVEKSVQALKHCDVAGLCKAYFHTDTAVFLWQVRPVYVCEATMSYKRNIPNTFGETGTGEGLQFLKGANLKPHDYIDGFKAIIHGNNTASHLQLHSMKKIS